MRDLLVMRAAVDDNDAMPEKAKGGDGKGDKVRATEGPLDYDEVDLMPKKIKEEVKQAELKKQQEKFKNLEIKATVVPQEEIVDVLSFNLPAKINEKAEQIKEKGEQEKRLREEKERARQASWSFLGASKSRKPGQQEKA